MINVTTQSATLAETALCPGAGPHTVPVIRKKVLGRVVAAVASMAILFGSTAPGFARERDNDLAKALVAAIVLGVIANEVSKNKRHHQPAPAPLPEPVRHPRVPEVCAIEVDGAERSVTIYPESCLRDEGFDYQLPRNCAKTARVYGRVDRIYGVQCLRSAGFRVSGY
jgi:hypothetical protein